MRYFTFTIHMLPYRCSTCSEQLSETDVPGRYLLFIRQLTSHNHSTIVTNRRHDWRFQWKMNQVWINTLQVYTNVSFEFYACKWLIRVWVVLSAVQCKHLLKRETFRQKRNVIVFFMLYALFPHFWDLFPLICCRKIVLMISNINTL